MHTPLMLQVVLRLDAATIASAFLTSPAAMGQRLSRAKPGFAMLALRSRFPIVRTAGPARRRARRDLRGLRDRLGRCGGIGFEAGGADAGSGVAGSHPAAAVAGRPEARGLFALMLFCEARRPARRAANGDYVPMSEQDSRLWSLPMLCDAERELTAAAARNVPGASSSRPRCSPRMSRRSRGRIDWRRSRSCTKDWSAFAGRRRLGRPRRRARRRGPAAGLEALDPIDP